MGRRSDGGGGAVRGGAGPVVEEGMGISRPGMRKRRGVRGRSGWERGEEEREARGSSMGGGGGHGRGSHGQRTRGR